MSKLKLSVVIGSSLIFLFTTGALILVKNRFKPIIVRTWVLNAASEVFPGAKVAIGDLQLDFGLNIFVRISDFALRDKEKNVELFDAHACVMKLPLWTILTSEGAAEVLFENPKAYYLSNGDASNWMDALRGTVSSGAEAKNSVEKSQFKFISKILKRVMINVKVGNLDIFYNLPSNKTGKFHVEKFIIKGLNLDSNTAFELASNLNVGLGKHGKAQFELLAIGQFNLAEILFNSVIKTKTIVHLKNFVLPPETWQIPEIKAEVDLSIDKNNNLHGPVLVNFGGSAMSADMNGTLDDPQFDSLTVDFLVEDLSNILMLKHSRFAFGSSRVHIDGKVSIKEKNFFPELKFGLSTPVIYKDESLKANISLSGLFREGNYDISSGMEMLGGSINIRLKGMLDVNNLPNDLSKYPPFTCAVNANKLVISKDGIHNLVFKKIDEFYQDNITSKDQFSLSQQQKNILQFPSGDISIVMSEIKTGVAPLNMEANIRFKSESLEVIQALIKYTGDDKGLLKLTSKIKIGINRQVSGKFKTDFQAFNVQGLYPFIPALVDNVTGTFTGKAHAGFSMGKNWDYYISTDITAKKGEVRGINFKQKIFQILEKWEKVRVKAPTKFSIMDDLDQHFDSLELTGDFTDTEYKIQKFNISGGPKRMSIKSKGVMYKEHISKDGEFFLALTDSKLKKYFGISTLPLRMFGKGLWPTIDYEYTLEKL